MSEAHPNAPDEAEELPSTGLLSFYDRLRERVLAAAERRGGRAGAGAAKVLLLAPDVFLLLLRLSLDREVPKSQRALMAGALAYFVLPADLLPELVLGGAGYLEDVVLACAVLAQAFGDDLEPWARKYWSGPQELRPLLRDVAGSARAVLGGGLYERLRALMERRGMKLDA